MNFKNFAAASYDHVANYMEKVADAATNGKLDSKGDVILFPNMFIATNCKNYYVVELVGASQTYDELKKKAEKCGSVYKYFHQFEEDIPDNPNATLTFDTVGNGVINFSIGNNSDQEAIAERFPSIHRYQSKMGLKPENQPIYFGPNFESCFFSNCLIVNNDEHIYRCKHILFSAVFKNNITRPELASFYKSIFNQEEVSTIWTVSDELESKVILASQLQNMFLSTFRETTIGDFLDKNRSILMTAFNSNQFVYEPYLEWKEHSEECQDTAINPDLLIKRSDGFYDIYDLKTAKMDKKDLTKGSQKRRRFVDYVEEGVSQLVHYSEYFQYARNKTHAKEKYGVEVQNPNLVLVVGNSENIDKSKLREACRKYSKQIEVVDYDTVCQLFLSK